MIVSLNIAPKATRLALSAGSDTPSSPAMIPVTMTASGTNNDVTKNGTASDTQSTLTRHNKARQRCARTCSALIMGAKSTTK